MASLDKPSSSHEKDKPKDRDKKASKVHKLSLKGSAKLVAEFFQYSIHSILYQRGVYPAEDFTVVKKYNLSMLVSSDDQVKAYIKRIMGALDRWMKDGRVQKLVIVITDKDTSEHVERWQFDVNILAPPPKTSKSTSTTTLAPTFTADQENAALCQEQQQQQITQPLSPSAPPTEAEIQSAIAALFRQITASVTFLPQLDAGAHTFNVLVYADAAAHVPLDWGDSADGGKEIAGGERVQLRGFSTGMHEIGTVVDYRGDF